MLRPTREHLHCCHGNQTYANKVVANSSYAIQSLLGMSAWTHRISSNSNCTSKVDKASEPAPRAEWGHLRTSETLHKAYSSLHFTLLQKSALSRMTQVAEFETWDMGGRFWSEILEGRTRGHLKDLHIDVRGYLTTFSLSETATYSNGSVFLNQLSVPRVSALKMLGHLNLILRSSIW
jgi:hypothetical protein